jgi:hypothetical protein
VAYKDASKMMWNLLPKSVPSSPASLAKVCRTMHLAFKTLTTDEVYDVMVMCFLRACHLYDPGYHDKIKQVCEVLNGKAVRRQFTAGDITPLVGFDAARHVRLLVGKGYLEAILGEKRKVSGYKKSKTWPPPPSFFQSGPVGFAYFATKWFRFFVAEHITKAMAQIETKAGMLQLGHDDHPSAGKRFFSRDDFKPSNDAIPHADGNFTDQNGRSWAADTGLMLQQLDISVMSNSWVKSTTDRFFRNLTVPERGILQMVFHHEFNWVQMAAMLECNTATVRKQYNEIMQYLRGHIGLELQAA